MDSKGQRNELFPLSSNILQNSKNYWCICKAPLKTIILFSQTELLVIDTESQWVEFDPFENSIL